MTMSASGDLTALFVQKMYETISVSMTNTPAAQTNNYPHRKQRGENNPLEKGVVLNYNYKLVY